MRFVCESCRAQYMINDEKVGPKGVKVRCRKCGYVIHVKRTDAPAAKGAPVPADPEDGLATQVMNSPLAGPATGDATLDLTNPGTLQPEPPTSRVNMNDPVVQAAMEAKAAKTAAAKNGNGAAKSGQHDETATGGAEPKPGDSFLGADEDEIGAVFDSVLAGGVTGPTTMPTGALDSKPASEGDRESTKVLDAELVKKLAEESNTNGASNPALNKVEEVPQQDWYVALNDKQTGPMPLEQLKQHWDKGEVGPDSLCWRAGFSDWIPVSEVKILASVLAPKPAKPIVVAPPATVNPGMLAPAVVSVPVQSAFSAGGVVTTVQSEVQVPIAAAGVPSPSMAAQEDTGTWRPSAASALASLVKEEMEVLAKPPKKAEAPTADPISGGLLDLPVEAEKPAAPAPVASDAPSRPAPPPVNPYMANPGATFSAPAVTQYRPPSNRGLLIGLGVGGGVLLLSLIVLVIFLALREPKVVVAPPPPVAQVQPPTPPTPPPPANPTGATPTPPAPNPVAVAGAPTPPAPPAPLPADAKAEAKAEAKPDAPAPAGAGNLVAKAPRPTGSATRREAAPVVEKKEEKPPEKREEKAASSGSGGSGDDFDSLFGDGKGKKAAAKEEKAPPEEKKKAGGYIPPPPGSAGGGDVKDALEQGDILEVVSANRGALAKCAEEQRKKEPGTTGRLVMKWTIQTTGKVTNVGVVSEEFKGTYMAGCVGGILKAMSFPRHKRQGDPVQFPFKF